MSLKRSLAGIHVAVLLFGLAGLFGKWLALPPVWIVFGRVFFAGLTLLPLLLATHGGLKLLSRKDGFLFVFLGLLLAVHWTCFFQSIQSATVGIGLLAYSSFPLFTVFLEPLFFRERIIPANLALAAVCLGGIFLIIPRFSMENTIFKGVIWGLAAGATFALLTIFNRKLTSRYSGRTIAFYQDTSAALFLVPALFLKPAAVTPGDVLLLLVLGVVCTAAAHSLFIQGMKHIRAQTAALVSTLEPVYGILLAFFILREIPSLRTILGGLLILLSVAAVSVRR
ncbi:MAG: DMT family transporter [Acidobacteria bacterium]|nr:DMT family transporter [Acidobacteriota bacterium]MCG2817312.1 DMT family transporter [Candidatus Aminicenantes bacterium]